jgi:hypothetical protein
MRRAASGGRARWVNADLQLRPDADAGDERLASFGEVQRSLEGESWCEFPGADCHVPVRRRAGL